VEAYLQEAEHPPELEDREQGAGHPPGLEGREQGVAEARLELFLVEELYDQLNELEVEEL